MNQGLISRRYASALWLYARKNRQEDRVYDEIRLLGNSFIQYPSFKRVLLNRTLSREKKLEVVTMVAGDNISHVLKNFLQLIFTNKRDEFLRLICLSFESIYLKEKKILKAGLVTAIPVDVTMKQHITQKIEESTGHSIHLTTAVNPSILGGYIVTVDTWRMDASLTTQLKRIKESLLETAINF